MKTVWSMFLLLIISNPAWSVVEKPFRTNGASPDKKYIVRIAQSPDTRWTMTIFSGGKEYFQFMLQDGEVLNDGTEREAWGFYDFAWSPDSKYIFFVFRPETMWTAAHTEDCFGIFDVKTLQYAWIAGPVVDKMFWQIFGVKNPNYELKWLDKETVSFKAKEARDIKNKRIMKAGVRKISLVKVCQAFRDKEQSLWNTIAAFKKALNDKDWRKKVEPLLTGSRKQKDENLIKIAKRKDAFRSQKFYIMYYNHQTDSIWVSQGDPDKSYGFPIEIKDGKIETVIINQSEEGE